jgi:hypothetical protein
MKKTKKLISTMILMMAGLIFSITGYATDESFQVSIRILTALSISENQALSFPDTTATASIQTVTVAPTDGTAASFDIAGDSNLAITASISETSVGLTNGSTTITIDTFTFGGSCNADGTGTLSSGSLAGCKVGASASIPANPTSGSYTGTLTFRVLYN